MLLAMLGSTLASAASWSVGQLVQGTHLAPSLGTDWRVMQRSGVNCTGAAIPLTIPYATMGVTWRGFRGTGQNNTIPVVTNSTSGGMATFGTGASMVTSLPGSVVMHPDTNQCAVVRFTAPTTGSYSFQGQFYGAYPGNSVGGQDGVTPFIINVQTNSIVAPTTGTLGSTAGGPQNFTYSVSLNAGQALDFAVEKNSAIWADSTGLRMAVTGPDPVTPFRASNFDFEGSHGCAIEQGTNILHCWGATATNGLMLGNGSTADQNKVVPATSVQTFLTANGLGTIQNIQVGVTNNCVRTNSNNTICFGANGKSESGGPPSGNIIKDVTAQLGGTGNYLGGRLDGSTGCIINSAKNVQCWGSNSDVYGFYPGKLGWKNGSWNDSAALLAAVPNVSQATDGAPGASFSCAVVDDPARKVICWGKTQSGWEQMGLMGNGSGGAALDHPDSSAGFYQAYVKTAAGVDLSSVKRVQTGNTYACALKTTGQLFCWGLNATYGGLTGAPTTPGPAPSIVDYAKQVGVPAGITDFAIGLEATCAVSGGQVFCQGRNDSGQLGQLSASSAHLWTFNPAYPGTYGTQVVHSNLTGSNPNPLPLSQEEQW